mmetsp:Transcript_2957/g.9793  ORF Transcript_2957/g.9793 Transcript_2957/m.9793 type:complete len:222 (-) Transcript_2957:90-755(-)
MCVLLATELVIRTSDALQRALVPDARVLERSAGPFTKFQFRRRYPRPIRARRRGDKYRRITFRTLDAIERIHDGVHARRTALARDVRLEEQRVRLRRLHRARHAHRRANASRDAHTDVRVRAIPRQLGATRARDGVERLDVGGRHVAPRARPRPRVLVVVVVHRERCAVAHRRASSRVTPTHDAHGVAHRRSRGLRGARAPEPALDVLARVQRVQRALRLA